MNHIGDEETELIRAALPFIDMIAPQNGIAEWSYEKGLHEKETRPVSPDIIHGHDLVLDWGMLGLRIKECSFNPRGGQQWPEIKHFVVRSTELSHEQVAQLVTERREQQLGLEG
jgi:hypothetical protein